MFDNLVESSSHRQDISRKGSFILATTLIYAVLIAAFVVVGIVWYDAHLSELELELTTLVAPVPVPQQQKEPEQKQEAKPQKVEQNVDVRKELVADVAESRLPPKEISAKASDVPPVRRGVTTVIGSSDSNASAPMPAGPGSGKREGGVRGLIAAQRDDVVPIRGQPGIPGPPGGERHIRLDRAATAIAGRGLARGTGRPGRIPGSG